MAKRTIAESLDDTYCIRQNCIICDHSYEDHKVSIGTPPDYGDSIVCPGGQSVYCDSEERRKYCQ